MKAEDSGILDPSALDTARLFAMEDLFQQEFPGSLKRFLENATLYSGEITKAVAQQDWQIARDNAHKLKSSAAMFGLPVMSAICVEIEAKAVATDHGNIAALAGDLGEQVTKAARFFASFLGQQQALRDWLGSPGATK